MIEVTEGQFYAFLKADPRDIMPRPFADVVRWETRGGVLVGETFPGYKHPEQPERYTLTESAEQRQP